MEPKGARRELAQGVVVLIVVPVVLVLAFLLLLVLNLVVGSATDAMQAPSEPYGDPDAFSPVTGLRLGWAAALVIAFLLAVRTRIPDLAKVALLAAAVGVPTAALLVTLYERPVPAFGVAVAIAAVAAVALAVTRRPWTWFLAAGWAWALGMAYGWPL